MLVLLSKNVVALGHSPHADGLTFKPFERVAHPNFLDGRIYTPKIGS